MRRKLLLLTILLLPFLPVRTVSYTHLQWTYIAGSGGLIEGYHRVRYEDAAGEAADIDQCAESHHVPICLVVVSG